MDVKSGQIRHFGSGWYFIVKEEVQKYNSELKYFRLKFLTGIKFKSHWASEIISDYPVVENRLLEILYETK